MRSKAAPCRSELKIGNAERCSAFPFWRVGGRLQVGRGLLVGGRRLDAGRTASVGRRAGLEAAQAESPKMDAIVENNGVITEVMNALMRLPSAERRTSKTWGMAWTPCSFRLMDRF